MHQNAGEIAQNNLDVPGMREAFNFAVNSNKRTLQFGGIDNSLALMYLDGGSLSTGLYEMTLCMVFSAFSTEHIDSKEAVAVFLPLLLDALEHRIDEDSLNRDLVRFTYREAAKARNLSWVNDEVRQKISNVAQKAREAFGKKTGIMLSEPKI